MCHWVAIGQGLQDAILKCQLLLVEELSPLEFKTPFEIARFCQSLGGGIKSHFYAPASKDQGHIVLPISVCWSVCLTVCPSVCLHKLKVPIVPN